MWNLPKILRISNSPNKHLYKDIAEQLGLNPKEIDYIKLQITGIRAYKNRNLIKEK